MSIIVVIDPSRFDNPIHRGIDTLRRLQQAGVPVIGVTYPEAVEDGVLMINAPDLGTGEVTYSWTPE